VIVVTEKPPTANLSPGQPVVVRRKPLPYRARGWLRLPPDPVLVREARNFATAVMDEAGVQEKTLVGDVRLLTSEAVTNAMRAAERYATNRGRSWRPYEFPVALRVVCRPLWVHVLVIDPDPEEPKRQQRDPLDELGGRGLQIIEEFAALWWFRPGTYGKTLHMVVTRPGVDLTPGEIRLLKNRVIM
jgi:anti-sigma regulatory factor (Ser/Thr protein kinase)